MITVEEARSILIENTIKSEKTCKRNIRNCSGYFLAKEVYSQLDLPSFNQSNVDGYAIRISDTNKYKIVSEIQAGDNPKLKLKKGEVARIFTGAVVPEGSDCIVMQENVGFENENVIVNKEDISKGKFIRLKGSQIRKGDLALSKNTFINPAVNGFLAALGKKKVSVYKKPIIHLLITGNELQSPGNNLKRGKVYESNSFIISSALEKMGVEINSIGFIKDKKRKLRNAVSKSLEKADVIMISGGVSVGKYDFVNEVLEHLGVTKLFYKVSQRPGKPLYFGKKNDTYVFGLPGNPASVFTCFCEYVYPMLRKYMGYDEYFLTKKSMPVLKDIEKSFSLSNFLKAKISNGVVESLEGQASYILRSFAESNCFICLSKETSIVKAGEEVEVHLFP